MFGVWIQKIISKTNDTILVFLENFFTVLARIMFSFNNSNEEKITIFFE